MTLTEPSFAQETFDRFANLMNNQGTICAHRRKSAVKQTPEIGAKDTLETWNLNYLSFLDKKSQWSAQATKDAINIGSTETLARFGASTKDAIADATNFIIADLPIPTDLTCLMNRILDRTMLSGLIGSAKTLSGGIGAIEPVLFTSLGKNPYSSGDMLDKIRTFQTEENEELTARLALVQYEQMLDTLDESVDGLEEQIDDANERVGGSLRKMFINEGFRQSGRNFTKKTLVASTLWKNKYKTHSIEGYRNYRIDIRDLMGPSGLGKSHLMLALGHKACMEGFTTYHTTCIDLIENLVLARENNRLKRRLVWLRKPHLLLIDEVGYEKLTPEQANMFFQVVNTRYEQGSIIITTNKPFGRWAEIMSDEAVASATLDRLLHHAHILSLQGDSYRMKDRLKTGVVDFL